jgi:signal transduction histidine kinase
MWDVTFPIYIYQQECPQPSRHLQEKLEDLDLDFLEKDLQKLLKSMRIGSDRIRQIVLSLRNFSRLDESDMSLRLPDSRPRNCHAVGNKRWIIIRI